MKTLAKSNELDALQDFQSNVNKKSNFSTYLKTFLFFVLVIGSIFYQNIDLSDAFDKVRNVASVFIFLLFLSFLLVEFIQVPIISILMRHFNIKLPYKEIYSINLISQFYSLTPLSGLAGGFVRWYRFGKKDNKHSEVFTAIVIQKVLFILSILSFGLVILALKNPFDNNVALYNTMIALSVILLLAVFVSFYIITHDRIMAFLSYFLVRPTLKTLPTMISSPFQKVWAAVKKYRGAYKPLLFSFFLALVYQIATFFLFYAIFYVVDSKMTMIQIAVLFFFFKGSMEILPIMSVFTLFLFGHFDLFSNFQFQGEDAIAYSLIMASFYFLIGGVFELVEKINTNKKNSIA